MDYPYDLVTVKRKKSTLSVEAHYKYIGEQDPEKVDSPLRVFHPSFSLYRFSIIEAGVGASFFTIHMNDVPGIAARTDAAAAEYYRPRRKNTEGVPNNPAFTERFNMGAYKGKSPVDVLVENGYEKGGEGRKILNTQYTFLKKNVEKYPDNGRMINAIMEASKLTDEELKQAKPSGGATPPMQLISIGCRPLTYDKYKREDGRFLCYEGSAVWDMDKDYPVCVTARNYYAPVKKNEDGTLNVQLNQLDRNSEKVRTFNLTADEWLNLISELKYSKEAFRVCNFSKAYTAAEAAGEVNRKSQKTA